MEEEHRYSLHDVLDALSKPIMGEPDRARTCTSRDERQNLTPRMQIGRMKRLTNAFSVKWENLSPPTARTSPSTTSAGLTRRPA